MSEPAPAGPGSYKVPHIFLCKVKKFVAYKLLIKSSKILYTR